MEHAVLFLVHASLQLQCISPLGASVRPFAAKRIRSPRIEHLDQTRASAQELQVHDAVSVTSVGRIQNSPFLI